MAHSIILSSQSGTAIFEGAPKYVGAYLKPGYLEFGAIGSPSPISWHVGDYVVYSRTGKTYRLYRTPQAVEQGQSNKYGASFLYENVQFFDDSKQLEFCPFTDLVPGDNTVHFSTQNTVSFFGKPLNVAERLEACLVNQYGAGSWSIRIVTTSDTDLLEILNTEAEFSVSGANCLEVLDKVYDIWGGLGWIHTVESGVNVITIGASNVRTVANTTAAFSYGNGLVRVQRSIANADQIGTRLYAYGSMKNMDATYYRGLDIKDAESVDIEHLMIPIANWGTTDSKPDARKAYIENAAAILDLGLIPRTAYFDGTGDLPDIHPTIEDMTIGEVYDAGGAGYVPNLSKWSRLDRVDEIVAVSNPTDHGTSADQGQKYIESTTGNVASVTRGFYPDEDVTIGIYYGSVAHAGNVSLRFGQNAQSIQITGSWTPEFNLSVEFAAGNSKVVIPIVATQVSASAWSFKLPESVVIGNAPASSTVSVTVIGFVSGSSAASDAVGLVTDSTTSVEINVEHDIDKTFTVRIPQIGFDIEKYAALGNGKKLSMKTGMCGAREFEIQDVVYNSSADAWDLTLYRAIDEDLNIMFPNVDYQIASGDQFVLLDIAMPEMYVTVASSRLLAAAQKLLADISSEKPFYSPQIDAKVVYNESRVLREGMWMNITQEGNQEYCLIDSITIDENGSNIPTYEVALREKKGIDWTENVGKSGSSRSSVSVNGGNQIQSNGTVTSVGMTVPTGLEVVGSPITGTGVLKISLASGYKIPLESELGSYFEVGSPSTLVQLKSAYSYLGPRKGLIFEQTAEADVASSPAHLMLRNYGTAADPIWALYTPYAIVSAGDQVIGNGASPGGGGGGGASYLKELLDTSSSWTSAFPTGLTETQVLVYTPGANSKNGTGTGAWSYAPASSIGGVTSVVGQTGAVTTTQIADALTTAGYKLTDTVYTLPLAASGTRGGIQIGYSESGTNYAVKLSSEKAYVSVPWTDTKYKLTLNGTTNGDSSGTSLGSFYAPTTLSGSTYVLIGGSSAPAWTLISGLSVGDSAKLNGQSASYYATAGSVTTLQGYFDASGNANSALKLTTVSKTAWGQTYWTSGGVPDSISGDMSSVGNVTPSANNSKNLGSSSVFWANTYSTKYYLNDTIYFTVETQGTGSSAISYVRLNAPLMTDGDQVIGSGASPGGGGGGGSSYLKELLDVYGHDDSPSAVKRADGSAVSAGDALVYYDTTKGWVASAGGFLPLSGGNMTGAILMAAGLGIQDTSGYNLLTYGTDGAAVGYAESSGKTLVLRSGNNNLIHKKYTSASASTDYTIYDASNLTKSVLTGLLDASGGYYLPLSGGTLSANSANFLNLNSTNSSGNNYIYFDVSSTHKAAIGYYSNLAFISGVSNARIGVADDGTPQYWSSNSSSTAKTIWHAGNSNKSDVNWTCSNLYCAGETITATNPTIIFKNSGGNFGRLYMAAANGPFYRINSDWSAQYTIYDSGNFIADTNYLTPGTAASTYVSDVSYNTTSDRLVVTKNGTGTNVLINFATNSKRLVRANGTSSAGGYDLNTLLTGGGITSQYGSPTYWANGPSGMSYGGVAQFNTQSSDSLTMQFAWDVVHNVADGTNRLWWRDYNNLGWGGWREIYHSGNANSSSVAWAAKTLAVGENDSGWTSTFTATNSCVYLADAAGGNGIYVGSKLNDETGYLLRLRSNQSTLGSGGTDRLTVLFNGKTGIGTASPRDTLTVDGVVAPFTNASYSLGTADYSWSYGYFSNAIYFTRAGTAGGSQASNAIVSSGRNSGFYFYTTADADDASPAVAFSMDKSKTARSYGSFIRDGYDFHNRTDARIYMGGANSTTGSLILQYSNGNYVRLGAGTVGAIPTLLYGLYFRLLTYNTSNTLIDAVRITRDGYVGILNTSPSQALDVTGNIHATGIVRLEAGQNYGSIYSGYHFSLAGIDASGNAMFNRGGTGGIRPAQIYGNGITFYNNTPAAVATLDNAGYLSVNRVYLNRSSASTNGRISFYSSSYYTWFEYMNTVNSSYPCPTGAANVAGTVVKTWARRSLIENAANFGWVWESCTNTANASPVIQMELSSNTGTLVTRGDQVLSSDERLKTNIKPVELTVKQIAKMRAVTFDFKKSGLHTLGVIAQDWEEDLPEAVVGGEYLNFKYAQTAMVSAIILARHETEQDKEIKKLKSKVKKLEIELARLNPNYQKLIGGM